MQTVFALRIVPNCTSPAVDFSSVKLDSAPVVSDRFLMTPRSGRVTDDLNLGRAEGPDPPNRRAGMRRVLKEGDPPALPLCPETVVEQTQALLAWSAPFEER